MLHHDDGVPRVAQSLQRLNQPTVVALVQSDAGLVQDVEHVHQLRPNLRGQPDALALSAGEGNRRTVERQIVQPHVEQELQSRTDFLQDLRRNLLLAVGHALFHVHHPVVQLTDIHGRQLRDVLSCNQKVERLFVEPLPPAVRAGHRLGKLLGPLLGGSRAFAFLQHLYVFHQTLVGHIIVRRSVHQLRLDAHAVHAAIEYFVQRLLGQFPHGRLHRGVVFLQQSIYLPENHAVLVFSQRKDGPFVDRQVAVGNHLVHVYQADVAQALAPRACPLRRVEREIVGSRVAVGQPRLGAHQALAVVAELLRVRIVDHQFAVALLHGRGHAGPQPLVVLLLHAKLVHHDFNAVVTVAVELHAVADFRNFAVHPHVKIPFAADGLEQLLVVSFAVAHDGREQVDAPAVVVVNNKVYDLFLRVSHHLLSGEVRIGFSRTGI